MKLSTAEVGTAKDWIAPCIRTHLSSSVPGINENDSNAKRIMQQYFRIQLISFLPCDRRKRGTPLYTIVDIISLTAWKFPISTDDVTAWLYVFY